MLSKLLVLMLGVGSSTIIGPDTWVSFRAIETTDRGGVTFVGRVYQGSNGSTRLESGLTLEVPTTIQIDNLTDWVEYLWIDQQGWRAAPIVLQNLNGLPLRRTLQLGPKTEEGPAIEGFRTIRQGVGSPAVNTVAPDLNFFTVEFAHATEHRRLREIVLEPVDEGLFSPPPVAFATLRWGDPVLLAACKGTCG